MATETTLTLEIQESDYMAARGGNAALAAAIRRGLRLDLSFQPADPNDPNGNWLAGGLVFQTRTYARNGNILADRDRIYAADQELADLLNGPMELHWSRKYDGWHLVNMVHKDGRWQQELTERLDDRPPTGLILLKADGTASWQPERPRYWADDPAELLPSEMAAATMVDKLRRLPDSQYVKIDPTWPD